MANVATKVADIRTKVYGKDVRESLASGIETINAEVVSTTAKENALEILQRSLRTQYDNQIINMTLDSPSDAEIVAARLGEINLLTKIEKIDLSLNDNAKQLKGIGISVKSFLCDDGQYVQGDGIHDDITGMQLAHDTESCIYYPDGEYKTTDTLYLNYSLSTLRGLDSGIAGIAKITYYGTGIAVQCAATCNYLYMKSIKLKGSPLLITDYYRQGSVGIDTTLTTTAITMENCEISNFETLSRSASNGYYNKFINNRFTKALICLSNLSSNNLEIKGNRFTYFNDAITISGNNGPTSIEKNSFEVFNGAILNGLYGSTSLATFRKNYIEIFDDRELPTDVNFPNNESRGSNVGFYGANILFIGSYGSLTIRDNDFQVGACNRLAYATVAHFESVGNQIHLFSGTNLMTAMWRLSGVKSYEINDILGDTHGERLLYSIPYEQVGIINATPYNKSYFHDCILGKQLFNPQKLSTITPLNGWITGNTTVYGEPKGIVTNDGLRLQGIITGTGKTDNIICTIPSDKRPREISNDRSHVAITVFADYGSGNPVSLKYEYATGTLSYNSGSLLNNIILDGALLPTRI